MRQNTTPSDGHGMFYQSEMEQALRLGDVVKGFVSVTPNVNDPILLADGHSYSVDIQLPNFSVVLTPCCSIANQMISLTPLIKVRSNFLNNPHFDDDLTRINRVMLPVNAVHPDEWRSFTPEKQAERQAQGLTYTCAELFIYQEHPLFPPYKLGKREIGFYMIDFRAVYRLNCDKITREQQSEQKTPIRKSLQLSVAVREQLRSKIANYYTRTPEEDE